MKQDSYLALGPAGFHRVAYTEWGDASSPVAICVHGLTRNGRDFDSLAQALAADYHIFCPDVVGRGRSEWLPDAALYNYPQYLGDMAALIARAADGPVDWIGTSMGGLIGMMLASQRNSSIRQLVI